MRFCKILLVSFGVVLFAGISARQACSTALAARLLTKITVVESAAPQALSTTFIADGGHPLPPPPIAMDGGHPLPPPPMVADGGHPLPPPPSVSFQFGTAV
jgi:hypothetical protein